MAINKPYNNRAWLGVLPVLLIVAFSAVIPLMTVVNYSVQDILDFNSRFYVGLDWYRETLQDPRFIEAFGRQVLFSLSVLAISLWNLSSTVYGAGRRPTNQSSSLISSIEPFM